ncbi:MAG: M20/M25/M40 family metallo-hydrolase [Deltaproteobacteria bacterium]|nr:M20/M25/M40 family metallo-hydrolase [Deltaproteobacteria bacterium]
MRALLAAPILAVALAGCGKAPAADDAAPQRDAAPPDAAETCVPLGTCDWLDAYQRTIVGTLAGVEDIAPGLRIEHRASVAERDAARSYLLDQFAALGIAAVRHDYPGGANVIATLPATAGTGGTILVGAHFDGVSAGPGAADNATGVAIVLAVARYLRTVATRNHPVTFALFDQEELGLIGSKAYASELAAGGADLVAAHIFDMLSFDGDGDRAVELWSPSPELLPLYQEHGAVANMPIQPVTFTRSDHQAFLDHGFVAVGIGEEFESGDHTPHYHRATDTYDRVQFDHTAAVTHLAFTVIAASVASP